MLPDQRTKPAWQMNPPTFMLANNGHEPAPGIDLVGELTASKFVLFLHYFYKNTHETYSHFNHEPLEVI